MFLGFWAEDQILLTIAFGLFWIPSFVLIGIDVPLIADNPGIQYPTGHNITTSYNETYTYAKNLTGADNEVNLEHSYKTEQEASEFIYTTYHNRIYGILLMFVSVFGMVLSVGSMGGVTGYEGPNRINWKRFYK